MKNKVGLILAALVFASQAAMAQTLTVSAAIPAATGLTLTVTPVNATTNVFGTPSTTATTIPFGTLTLNPSLGIYLPTNYYTIGISASGGAGTPIVNVTYTEGTNPNAPGTSTHGLGSKATATFLTVNGQTQTVSSLGKKRLIDLTGTAGQLATIPFGSYELVDVGIWSGSTVAPADPTNGEPFSNSDVAGTYTGTLTFTAVTL